MAMVKYSRVDGNNSPNYSVRITVLVLVTTCLVGAWMMMSSSVGPVRMRISFEQFMGRTPQESSGNDGNLTYDVSKGNASQGKEQVDSFPNMQGTENAIQKSQAEESHRIESKEEKERDAGVQETAKESVSDMVQNNARTEQKNDGENGVDISDQKETKVKSDDLIHQNNDNGGKPDSIDREFDQSEKSGEEESKVLSERANDKTQESGFKNGPAMSNGGSPQVAVTTWPTQAAESEKERESESLASPKPQTVHSWKVCNVTAGPDYIPCLDNIQAIRNLPSIRHFEHRERHCPDEAPTCLVPLPKGYRTAIKWPKSREMIWFANVPHVKLAEYKRAQNWVKVYGRYITFPGGGTQFKHGALHYIDSIQEAVPDIAWGKRGRVILDVGCGVASFGGYLFERDVLTMSLAPKDEHEAQVQFALERGIPAISAVMGTKRLPFPAMVFDIVHCARCRVHWHAEGGRLLLELDRVLRPGGYFIWSATPVYRRGSKDVGIWKEMSNLTKSICWELVQVGKDEVNRVSAAIYRKPTSNDCYEKRKQNDPPLCQESDDPNAAWYSPMQACIHRVPAGSLKHGTQWPARWPLRLEKPPYWLDTEAEAGSVIVSKKFIDDTNYWKQVVAHSYLNEIGIDWSSVRNIMDMRTSYGGLAAALTDLKVWVMNVVPVNSSDTLPIIYERGLLGIYHDWCESFSTYPRSYDLLHADHLLSDLKKRCKLTAVMAEVDRILRPERWLIVRDDAETIMEVENMAKSLQWKIQFSHSNDNERLLCVQKTMWRPSQVETIISAIDFTL